MRALRKTAKAPGHVELLDVTEPEAPAGWVTLDVDLAGVCGTDIHILHDQHPYWPPVTLGHEFVGRIAELGESVSGWSVGDRVVCEPHQGACGVCYLCRGGFHHLCASKRSPGWGIDGGMAAQVAMPAHLLHSVPEGVEDRAAAVCEPAAVCLTAINRVRVMPGDTVVVIGPGTIGIVTALACKAVGAERVVVVGRAASRPRHELVNSLGLEVWDSSIEDVGEKAKSITAGRGVDVAFEASGSSQGIAMAVTALRRTGRLCAIGVSGAASVDVPWDAALMRALDVKFSFSSAYASWDAALSLMGNGLLNPAPLTTVYPLLDWETAFRAMEDELVVKALLHPDQEDGGAAHKADGHALPAAGERVGKGG